MTSVPKYRAPALDKGLDILELLARAQVPLSMTEIASGVGYSKGEIFRMLQVLEGRNYIARETDSAYALTNRLFMLGMERPNTKSLVEAALPVMHRLVDEVQLPCHLVVASEEQIVVIARVDSPSDYGFVVRVGHRRPLAHSTSGLVLFAFQGDATRARWLTILDAKGASYKRKRFIDNADAIRVQGYASLASEAVDGVTDLSAPILHLDEAVGTLTIPFVESHPARVTIKRAVERLRAAVEDISQALNA
jgi:DNA-binding IclR family transcriptional regulator